MSSFDDGFHLGMTSSDDFRSKFVSLMDERNISAKAMCQRAGVSLDDGMRAIQMGSMGLPNTLPTLQRLLAVFGVDISWLLNGPEYVQQKKRVEGKEPLEDHEATELSKRRALRTLVWDFIIRNQVPPTHRRPLVLYVLDLLESKPRHTMKIAARIPVPRTVMDVAYLYERLLAEGFFS
jgi:transcriptional regulator with XRE-family HTH domain